jgi:hypothetical protein
MAEINLAPIIESAHGVTLTSTWFILIREDCEYADSVFKKRAPKGRRSFELNLTLHHEFVHFLQGFTTAFTYSFSKELLNLFREMMQTSRDGGLDAKAMRAYRQTYFNYQKQVQKKVRGISAIDLLEAMAVTESFRCTAPVVDTAAFRRYLEMCFPPDSVYRRALTVMAKYFDEETALQVTSRVCFLALNGDDPANNFWHFIDKLSGEDPKKLCALSASDLATKLGMAPPGYLIDTYKTLPLENQHEILLPYLELLSSLAPYAEIFEFVARPGDWLRTPPGQKFSLLEPPLIMFSSGKGMKRGLAGNWNIDQLFPYFEAAGLVGACQRLLTDGRPYHFCPHNACPVHDTALCAGWFAVPQQIAWPECAFPKILDRHFKMIPAELMNVRAAAGGRDELFT